MSINKTCAGRIRAQQSKLVDVLIDIAMDVKEEYKPNERMAAIRTLFDSLDAYEAEQRIQLEMHPERSALDVIVEAMAEEAPTLALPESVQLPSRHRPKRGRGRPRASLDSPLARTPSVN